MAGDHLRNRSAVKDPPISSSASLMDGVPWNHPSLKPDSAKLDPATWSPGAAKCLDRVLLHGLPTSTSSGYESSGGTDLGFTNPPLGKQLQLLIQLQLQWDDNCPKYSEKLKLLRADSERAEFVKPCSDSHIKTNRHPLLPPLRLR